MFLLQILGAVAALFLLTLVIPPVRRFVYQKPWWTITKRHLATLMGKPYFKVTIFETGRGQVGIDAQYNIHFIYQLDGIYSAAGATHYNRDMEEQAKIAIYLYDSIGQIAENYMPLPTAEQIEGMDLDDGVPPMALNGGEEVRQVVDLANNPGTTSRLDVEMG